MARFQKVNFVLDHEGCTNKVNLILYALLKPTWGGVTLSITNAFQANFELSYSFCHKP